MRDDEHLVDKFVLDLSWILKLLLYSGRQTHVHADTYIKSVSFSDDAS